MALSRHIVEKLNNFTVWWNYHSDKVASYPLERKVEFLMQAVNSQNEILVEVSREVHGQKEGGSVLALPTNYSWGKKN